MYKLYLNIAFGFLFLLLLSCQNNDPSPSYEGKVPVTFSIDLPEQEEVDTRAGYTDNSIANMTLLVFDETGRFMERIDVDEADIIDTGNGAKFSVMLDITASNRTIHLIANAREESGNHDDRVDFSGLSTTATEEQIIPNLVTLPPPQIYWSFKPPLIMWGRVSLNGISITENVSTKLLRSSACIRILKNSLQYTHGFVLRIPHRVAQAYVAPSDYRTTVLTTPTTENPYPGNYAGYYVVWNNYMDYVYEGTHPFVILSGSYYDGSYSFSSYYKVALVNSDGTPMSIIRNHRYTINVLSVKGPGAVDMKTAIDGEPSNVITVYISDEDEELPHIISNSTSMIGVNCNSIQVIRCSDFKYWSEISNPDREVELCTVYSLVPPDTEYSRFNNTVKAVGNNKYILTPLNYRIYSDNENRYIRIRCDNLATIIPVEYLVEDPSPAVFGVNTSSFPYDKNSDADSYVFDLSAGKRNWHIWIPQPSVNTHVHLHSDSSPALLTGNSGNGFLTSMRSAYFPKAYLHVAKESGRTDVVIASYQDENGKTCYRRILIAQD